jgi:hypothetical protein
MDGEDTVMENTTLENNAVLEELVPQTQATLVKLDLSYTRRKKSIQHSIMSSEADESPPDADRHASILDQMDEG